MQNYSKFYSLSVFRILQFTQISMPNLHFSPSSSTINNDHLVWFSWLRGSTAPWGSWGAKWTWEPWSRGNQTTWPLSLISQWTRGWGIIRIVSYICAQGHTRPLATFSRLRCPNAKKKYAQLSKTSSLTWHGWLTADGSCVCPWVWPHETHGVCSTRMGVPILRLCHDSTSQFSSNLDDLE